MGVPLFLFVFDVIFSQLVTCPLDSYHRLYKEKGSKFIAFAFPVDTESKIKGKIDELRKEYFDARHHGYAWMLGADHNRFRAFDEGET